MSSIVYDGTDANSAHSYKVYCACEIENPVTRKKEQTLLGRLGMFRLHVEPGPLQGKRRIGCPVCKRVTVIDGITIAMCDWPKEEQMGEGPLVNVGNAWVKEVS